MLRWVVNHDDQESTPERRLRSEREREARERVLADLRQEIEARIRPVVSHLPEREIVELVQRMAWIKYKYDAREPAR